VAFLLIFARASVAELVSARAPEERTAINPVSANRTIIRPLIIDTAIINMFIGGLPEGMAESTSTEIEPVVTMKGGKLIADSRDVAATFGKRHDHVLRDIDNLLESGSPILGNQYFQQVTEFSEAANRNVRRFEMDRDGFSLLAMGFTGTKALRWKLKYIQAFNSMEDELRSRAAPLAR
jgi:Rha family phage regulatory protein